MNLQLLKEHHFEQKQKSQAADCIFFPQCLFPQEQVKIVDYLNNPSI